jgi:spermidine/putrescine transport system substrate-binding protein
MTKRIWTKRIWTKQIWIGAAVTAGLVSSLIATGAVKAQSKTLNLFIWSEYIDTGIIKEFEKANGVKVNASFYESNEDMLAKLEAGGSKQYDVIVPSSYIVPVLVKKNLVQPLDLTKVPNWKNLGASFKNPSFDPGNKYSLGYLFSLTGITYRKDKIKNPGTSWALFFDPQKQPGPFVMLDDSRSMIGIALKSLGKPYNSVDKNDLKAVIARLQDAKKRSLGFTGSPEGKNKVLSKQAFMAITYNNEAVRGMQEDKNIGFLIPKEGSEIALDSMMVPNGAANAANAYKFLNFFLDAKVAARNATSVAASTPNEAARAFVAKADRENPVIYPSAATLKTLEYAQDLGADLKLYDAVWTKVKAK